MRDIRYLDFDLAVEKTATGYRTRVLTSPVGQAEAEFVPSFSDIELENFFLKMGRTRQGVRRINSPEMESAKTFGGRLFNSLFKDDVRGCLRSSLDEANRQEAGLRLRLHLTGAPELVDLPWEFLYNATLNRFLCLSAETPLIRYIDLPERIRPLSVKPPLRVLVAIASPTDYPALDVDREWAKLNDALSDIVKQGLVTIDRLPDGQLSTLQRHLRQGQYHIFHFVGHGGFSSESQDGVLLLEDEARRGRQVSGQDLGMMLYDERTLRLVVLNACEGARTSRTDPFGGVAQSLVQQSIPAVIAMQFEITDAAAITLAHEFYGALADGYPVDAALGESRKALFADGNDIEWGTPVLYLRAPDGRIFDVQPVTEKEKQHAQALAVEREAELAMDAEDWSTAIEKWQSASALDPTDEYAKKRLKESQRQQKLAESYAQGTQALAAQRWDDARNAFQLILDQQSNYKDVAALIERISKATQRPAGTSGTAVEEPRTAQTPVLDALPVASPMQDKPLTALGQSAPALSRTAESAPSVNAEPPTLINAPPKRRRWNVGFVGALLGACIILACAGSIGVFGFGINPFPAATFPAPTAAPTDKPVAAASATRAPALAATTAVKTPTPVPSATQTARSAPPVVPVPAAESTRTPTPAPADTATKPAPTNTRAPTAPSLPPAVYVTGIRTASPPKGGQPVVFLVTFLNTHAGPVSVNWRMRIYRPENMRNSMGDTRPVNLTIPVGSSEQASADSWRVTGVGGCLPFIAQVFAVDPTTREETEFPYPNQARVTYPFQVCP